MTHRRLLLLTAALLLAFTGANAGPDEDLIAAINKGEQAKVERALKNKANPEVRAEKGATALMLAAELGHVDIARLLIGAGANVTTTRQGGIAAIHHAAGGGQIGTLKLLLAAGASASTRTESGNTPLLAAAKTGKLEVLQALLDAGADRGERDNNGVTVLMAAAQSGCIECMKLVRVEGVDINAHTTSGNSILDFAVAARSPAAWQYLFEQGAKLDAAKSARDRVLLSFITTPSDVLLKKPPIDIETYRMLIASGAHLEPRNDKGQTPLILAAAVGDATAVRALVEAKANVNALDNEQATVLISSMSRSVVENARMLLAMTQGTAMKQLFSAAEKSDKSPATANRLAIARLLIDSGADVNATDKDGNTALHKATQLGDLESVSLLLASSADVNARTSTGRTALMTSALWNYAECASALLAAGAATEMTTQDGKTAMDIAKANKHTDIIKLLDTAGKR